MPSREGRGACAQRGGARYHRRVIDAKTLLEDLTDAQREAVTHVDGPLLIVAAAGKLAAYSLAEAQEFARVLRAQLEGTDSSRDERR